MLLQILLMASLNDCSIVFHISVKIDLSIVDPHHMLCLLGNGIVVSDHDDGVSFFVEFLQKIQYFAAGFGIQRASRLIRQDQGRISCQGPGNGDTLLLSAR